MKYLLLSVFVLISVLCHAQITIIVVRHAEKEASSSRDPDLSPEGKARVAVLERMLSEVSIDRFFSTPYKRTRQTIVALAEKRGNKVQEYNPSAQEAFATSLKTYAGQTILVAGHSNTVPDLLNRLVGERKYESLDENEYDNLYVVTITDGGAKVICLKYGEE
jgi:broad specificity phosphatase PhoE